MSENDKKIIMTKANFLRDKGYALRIREYSVDYSKNNLRISIFYERYEDVSDVVIHFYDVNKFYYVSWLASSEGITLWRDASSMLKNVLILLDFIHNNYESIINPLYCKKTYKSTTRFSSEKDIINYLLEKNHLDKNK